MIFLKFTVVQFFSLVVADYIISTIPKMLQVEKVFSLKKKSGLIGALKKEKISVS